MKSGSILEQEIAPHQGDSLEAGIFSQVEISRCHQQTAGGAPGKVQGAFGPHEGRAAPGGAHTAPRFQLSLFGRSGFRTSQEERSGQQTQRGDRGSRPGVHGFHWIQGSGGRQGALGEEGIQDGLVFPAIFRIPGGRLFQKASLLEPASWLHGDSGADLECAE
jgi:hypothetical protein